MLLAGTRRASTTRSPARALPTALRSAELLAEVAHPALFTGDVSAGALAPLRWPHAAFAGKARVTQALQLIIAHRRLANAAARFLQRRPALLGTLMGVIGDFGPPRALLRGLRG
jgi:hypothetical protein